MYGKSFRYIRQRTKCFKGMSLYLMITARILGIQTFDFEVGIEVPKIFFFDQFFRARGDEFLVISADVYVFWDPAPKVSHTDSLWGYHFKC